MAAALAKSMLTGNQEVLSAGIECTDGLPAARNAMKVLRERGIDLSTHRTRSVASLSLQQGDIAVAMTAAIAERLRHFGAGNVVSLDVEDPYGGDLNRYRVAADEIARQVASVLRKIAWIA